MTVKSATVNAWYHGGDQLESIAEQVMQDVESRQLKFPDLGVLLRPLRSAYNGSFANQQEPSKNGLARWIVWHMLVHPFDWLKTSENIIETVAPIIASQESFRPRFLSFGPSSEWLVGGFRSHALHPKFDVTDLSAFHATQTADLPTSHEGDIAIVGMGVNFPRGHGQEELWNALFRGTIAVSEVGGMKRAAFLFLELTCGRYLNPGSMLLITTMMMAVKSLERWQLVTEPLSMIYGNLITPSSE